MDYETWYQSGYMVIAGKVYPVPPRYPVPAITYVAEIDRHFGVYLYDRGGRLEWPHCVRVWALNVSGGITNIPPL